MKRIRYSKYVPDLAGEMDLDELMEALSDYLLQSGFEDPYSRMYGDEQGDQSLDALREAIREALLNGELFDEETQQQIDEMQADGSIEQLIDQIVERMQNEDMVTVSPPHDPTRPSTASGSIGEGQSESAKFEVTDKGLDFLGYRTL